MQVKEHLMRLAEFILENVEPIVAEWETFARSVPSAAKMDKLALRDHAEDILRATAWDMKSAQTGMQRSDKSKGNGNSGAGSIRLDGASDVHAVGRVSSGFDLLEVVSEYRALRASVVRLWRESVPAPDVRDVDDLTRFNESIDQSLTEAVRSYTERVDRSRQMFLAILGHDLRNPLNSVMMSAEVLRRTSQLDEECSEMAAQISASATVMARLISDLLDFTSTGLGAGMPLAPAAMDLAELCGQAVDEMRAAYPRRDIGFQSHGDLAGEWDTDRLRQVCSNLLGNAIQHGADPIKVSARAEAGHVVLAIRNGGPPISPDVLPTIFDPLVRDSSTDLRQKRRPGSIGLGLYIAREVVTAHGGTMDVESSADAGTVFTVCLPRRGGATP
jgi:hypothetical protein